MSLYSDASLVMIPSAYKDGKLYSIKPTDGSGDFTFSRGSNLAATRVDENGLIEKGRENLLLQSNSFSTSPWESNQANREAVVSSGESGYDGSNDAWLVLDTTGSGLHQITGENLTLSGVNTASVYAKAYTNSRYLGMAGFGLAGGNEMPVFDLENGTIDMPSTSNILKDATITSVGNGWYRCSMMFVYNGTSSFSITLCNTATDNSLSGYTYTGTGSNGFYIQDAQLEAGLVATDYIETTTTTAQAGILEDMPRLDYSGGASCPSLLLEPTRTNLIPQSEYINASVSSWSSFFDTIITNNDATSPEGVNNATKISCPIGGSARLDGIVSSLAAGTYTYSFYAKGDVSNLDVNVYQDATGTTLSTTAIETLINGSQWSRVTITFTSTALSTIRFIHLNLTAGEYFHLWGAMLESGSYPTSYIPCYGAATTRSFDKCFKTSATSLIGQTQGTIFFDFVNSSYTSSLNVLFQLRFSGGSGTQVDLRIGGGTIIALANNGGVNQFFIYGSSASVGTRYKCALRYLENDSAFYINGVKVGSDTSCTFTSGSLDQISFAESLVALIEKQEINQAAVFKTALTDSELAALTTI